MEREASVWWYMQVDDTEAVNFLVTSQVIPLCLRIMETGSELSKTVCHIIFCMECHRLLPLLIHAMSCYIS